MNIRVGIGVDVHQLAEGETLNLGGIVVPHTKGTVGHSDADVLIHAVCDALLGAAGLRDIGFYFPDTSPDFKGVDSKILLQKTNAIIQGAGYFIGNIDCTLSLERPKIKDYIPEMIEVLAKILAIPCAQLNIKATTTEKLGFEGREEGVSCQAVALVYKN